MSFEVNFYRNESESNKLDKTIVSIITAAGVLRDDTSIIDPIIEVSASLETLAGANYVVIPTFNRSYFILDMTATNNGLVLVSCHVDVLSSFRNQIRANRGIVFRQENNWNLYLNDGVLEMYQNPIVTTHEFPNAFNGQSYVLALAGRYTGGRIPDGGGNNPNVKTPMGLATYALAQVGNPYWFGTCGQIASQALLDDRSYAYPEYYTATDFPSQFGLRVHDCVGLIKGYRWSTTPTAPPAYVLSQDVNVEGLYTECSVFKGIVGDTPWTQGYQYTKGVCLFTANLDHVGVSMGDGTAVEARNHASGVVQTNNADRSWYYWGIPDWLINNTDAEA